MRVAIGTVEISDEERSLIAWDLGEHKLATRDEVREYLEGAIVAKLQELREQWDDEADDWL